MYIGVCGLQGSGKSSLAKYLQEKYPDYILIDIDKVGHLVNELPEVKKELVETFGDILTDNKVDRKKLGKIVFNDKEKMNKLIDITWKHMEEYIDNLIKGHSNVIFDWQLFAFQGYVEAVNVCDGVIQLTLKMILHENVEHHIVVEFVFRLEKLIDSFAVEFAVLGPVAEVGCLVFVAQSREGGVTL